MVRKKGTKNIKVQPIESRQRGRKRGEITGYFVKGKGIPSTFFDRNKKLTPSKASSIFRTSQSNEEVRRRLIATQILKRRKR